MCSGYVDFWGESLLWGAGSLLPPIVTFLVGYVGCVFVYLCICVFSGLWVLGREPAEGSRFLASSCLATFPVRYTKAPAL